MRKRLSITTDDSEGPLINGVPPDFCGTLKVSDALDQLIGDLARADARIAELERECGALREFALEIMECWPHGDVDGCDLEIAAFKHGLIAMKDPKPTEPCGECCACSGYPTPEEWAEGIDCYVRTPLLTGAEARAGNGGEG